MALRRITPPATEPVTLEEAKLQCKAVDDDDTLVTALISAAREACEHELRRSLITQTWLKTLDDFGDAIRLDNPPIAEVSSVEYRDAVSGDWVTLDPAAYAVDLQSEPGWVQPANGYSWPSVYDEINAVKVTYEAGYGDAEDVPTSIKQWILLMVGHYYREREASSSERLAPLPFLAGLLDPHRIYTVA